MATGTGKIYTKALVSAFKKEIDFLETSKIKIALCSAVPTQISGQYFSEVTEIAGAFDYTSGGQILANPSITPSGADVVFDGDDTVWTANGGSIAAEFCVIYYDSGVAGTSPLISVVDFGAIQTATDGNTFTIAWNVADGVFKGTVAT